MLVNIACMNKAFADLFFYFFDSFDLQLKFKRMRRKLFTPILKNQQNRFGFIFTAHISPVHIIVFLQILRLVCKTCGKPCRSKDEQDLHSKRNPGHNEYVDETDKQGEVKYDGAQSSAASGGIFKFGIDTFARALFPFLDL